MNSLFQFVSLLLVFFGCIFILVPQQVIYLISSLTTSEHSKVKLFNIFIFFEQVAQVVDGLFDGLFDGLLKGILKYFKTVSF